MAERELTPRERELRGEAAAAIRSHLWLGKQPPPPPNPSARRPWSMGRDLSIWRRLVVLGLADAEELNGAITMVRDLLPRHAEVPLRMTIFYNSQGHAMPLLEQALARWRKHGPQLEGKRSKLPPTVAEVLRGMLE